MSVFPASSTTATDPASSASAATSSSSASSDGLDSSAFMTLLIAQLQNQDPFQPMDPTAMVSQLVEVNSLSELIQIRQDMDTAVGVNQNPTSQQANPVSSGS